MKSVAYSDVIESPTDAGPIKVIAIKVLDATKLHVKLELLVHNGASLVVSQISFTTDKVVAHDLQPECGYVDLWDWYFYAIFTQVKMLGGDLPSAG